MVLILNTLPLALVLISAYFVWKEKYWAAGFFLVLVVVLMKATPSYMPKGTVERSQLPPMEINHSAEIKNNLKAPVDSTTRDNEMREKMETGVDFLIKEK